jgi:meiosis arrest female protein 1
VDDTGVPLEHLVSCLPGIEIYQGVGCVKYLRWLKSKGNEDVQIDGEFQILALLNAWIAVVPMLFTQKERCMIVYYG